MSLQTATSLISTRKHQYSTLHLQVKNYLQNQESNTHSDLYLSLSKGSSFLSDSHPSQADPFAKQTVSPGWRSVDSIMMCDCHGVFTDRPLLLSAPISESM